MNELENIVSDDVVIPKQKRSQKSRMKILTVAMQAFAEKGFDGARIDEIAKKTKVNKQRIYAYFKSKKELYRAVLLMTYSKAAEDEQILALNESHINNLTYHILTAFFEFHENNPLFWQMLTRENLSGGAGLQREDWDRLHTDYIDHIRHLFTEGQRKGVFRQDIDSTSYLLLLFATTYFYFSNQFTISKLLNIKMDMQETRVRMIRDLDSIISVGVLAKSSSSN